MKIFTRFLLCILCNTAIISYSQSTCPGNLVNTSAGYYGGFEAGGSNISSTTAGSDLHNGLPRNGSYQIVQNVGQLGGGGYLNIRPRTGSYFLASHTSNNEKERIWYSKINVVPGSTYNFCTYVTLLKNLGNGANFIVGLYVNGTSIATGRVTFDWTAICGSYKVPAGVTSIELSIRDPKKGLFFLAVDDICVTGPPPTPVGNLCLGNQVWNDRDGDGKRDPNEPAIPGAPISLYTDNNSDNLPDGGAIKTTTSDAQGKYLFTHLAAGRYIASMPILPGYQQSPNTTTQNTSPFPDGNDDNDNNLVRRVGPNAPGGTMYTNAITLSANQEPINDGDGANGNLTFDLAECGVYFIGDFVWNDLDGDGFQDPGEPGINGVDVTITFPDGTTATEETHTYNANNNQNAPQYDGYYDFENLGPGTYKITFATPPGLNPSPANQGGNDAKDSDPVNGSVNVTITNNSDFTIDAGFTNFVNPPQKCPNLSLGNLVFLDANNNGKRDPNEAGVENVTVKLYRDSDGNNSPDGAAISTLMTAADGTYYFGNLTADKYIVGVVPGSGYMQGAGANSNPDNNIDNDNNGVTTVNGEIRSNFITLSAGNEPINDGSDNNSNLTLDFGLKAGAVPCKDHCSCKNDCDHKDCGHSNCGHNSCNNNCDHKYCGHSNCAHNSCKDNCDHKYCGHSNCGNNSHSNCKNNCDHKTCGHKNCDKYGKRGIGQPGISGDESKDANANAAGTSSPVMAKSLSGIIEDKMATIKANSLSIFPNPSTNFFTLKVNSVKEGAAHIRILDATGRTVLQQKTNVSVGSNPITFDKTTVLRSGTYKVQVIIGGQVLNQSLIMAK